MTSRLAVGVCALTLAAATPAAAQGPFPPDEAVREIARQAATLSGKIGIVIGVLEADGTRRVITVGDAPYDGRTLFDIGSITKVFTGIESPNRSAVLARLKNKDRQASSVNL